MRQKAEAALQEYLPQWNAWAEGERLRRKSISLYGDLFALRHQIEAEETAKTSGTRMGRRHCVLADPV